MDYTANHHLPQWEKSDRVMMDDFNQMCRDIETGLDQVQDSSDRGIGSVSTDLSRLHTAVEDLARDTYRRAVVSRLFTGAAGTWDSLWLNSLSSGAEAGRELWTGEYGVHLSGSAATEAGIAASATDGGYVCTVPGYNNRTAAVQFVSNGYGVIQDVKLFTESNSSISASENCTIYILLRRTDTGAVVAQSAPIVTERHNTNHCYYMRRVDFPLAAGIPYRMEFTIPGDVTYRAISGFMMATARFKGDTSQKLTILPTPTQASLTRSITPPAWARDGIVLVRWAGTGSITPAVNGQELPGPARTRPALNARGYACQETEYALDSLPEGPLELTASPQKGGGDLHLYDYGVLWR